jgi:hypothetical protein
VVASAGILIQIHEFAFALTPAQFLNNVGNFLVGQTFAKFLIRQIEGIKFAFDWNKRGGLPGVKDFKRAFVKKSFEADPTYRLLCREPDNDDIYNRKFAAFKTQHAKSVTARNYLLQLYQRVSNIILFIYIYHINSINL